MRDSFICGINIIELTINFHALPHKVLNRLRRLRGWLFCVLRRNDALWLRFRNLEISGVEVAFKGIAVDADRFLSGYVRQRVPDVIFIYTRDNADCCYVV